MRTSRSKGRTWRGAALAVLPTTGALAAVAPEARGATARPETPEQLLDLEQSPSPTTARRISRMS
ncbi:hypothetical protein [Streptomyces sp. NPDC051636]|uniref:hypothetical protein n=1 Tax=Streptomyces sp. NPDC051636 TaxID=3365663 RepID=UPI0037BC2657